MKLGKVKRPENGIGDKTVTLTATISRGTATATRQFTVKVREQGLSDTQVVASDKAALVINGADTVKANLVLPIIGEQGSLITWASDKPTLVTKDGIVNRPANGSPSSEVRLTATITSGAITDTKDIMVTVLPWTDTEEVDLAFAALDWEAIRSNNINETSITGNLNLAIVGQRETGIAWTSTNAVFIDATGKVTRPTYVQGDALVTLTATISKGSVQRVKQFLNLRVTRLSQTNEEAVDLALSSVTDDSIKGTNSLLTQVTSDLFLPKTVSSGIDATSVSFTWSQVKTGTSNASTYLSITDVGGNFVGNVTRPGTVDPNEDIVLTLSATSTTATGSASTKTKTFNVRILKQS